MDRSARRLLPLSMQLGTVVGRRPDVGVESGRLQLTYPDDQQRRLVELGVVASARTPAAGRWPSRVPSS
jgi:hypothetical protein